MENTRMGMIGSGSSPDLDTFFLEAEFSASKKAETADDLLAAIKSAGSIASLASRLRADYASRGCAC